jgi:hypothetical protein
VQLGTKVAANAKVKLVWLLLGTNESSDIRRNLMSIFQTELIEQSHDQSGRNASPAPTVSTMFILQPGKSDRLPDRCSSFLSLHGSVSQAVNWNGAPIVLFSHSHPRLTQNMVKRTSGS